ncbi:hypothetical protein J2W91_004612 [Paenibacillus amylolyticus]|uniref:Uncharacterized protein n=1 Tax=Paenibacillus amylolyticus TaxID=1451 RepID=A0AAP5H8X8_PAEAM|nr:hypothetical protein [Paenibacillus amylolyticus]
MLSQPLTSDYNTKYYTIKVKTSAMEMLLLILILFSIFLQSITFLLNWST